MKYNFDERGIAPKVREALEYLDGKTPEGGITQGVAVSNAAGAAPTAAEYNALLISLRNAGVISK